MEEKGIIEIKYQQVRKEDETLIKMIADWYFSEWNIPTETTLQRLSTFSTNGIPFQSMMSINNVPIATGGVYDHVGLLDREPRFKIHSPWLALVYTKIEYRNQGYGALLCNYIENVSRASGIKEFFLFTHTAETLYKRLGWQQIERIVLNEKEIVIMKKDLKNH